MSEQTPRTYAVQRSDEEWAALLSPRSSACCAGRAPNRRVSGSTPIPPPRASTRAAPAAPRCSASDTKFPSHCGWPSFYAPLAGDAVEYIEDRTHGMVRVEVRCAACGSHLGHVF